MFDLFLDIFARRDNILTRMDARPKIVVGLTLVISVIASPQVFMPLAVFLSCVVIVILLRVPARLVMLRLAAPLLTVFVLIVLQTFLVGSDVFLRVAIAGGEIQAYWEGLRQGVLMGSRILASVSVLLLLGSVTPAYKIFHAMRWFRVPEGWIDVALLIYRYIFTILDQTTEIAAAQSTRLGYSNMRRSIYSMGVLAGTVITRSMDQAMRTYEAMILRGYQGRIAFQPLPELTRADLTGMLVVIQGIVVFYMILNWWSV